MMITVFKEDGLTGELYKTKGRLENKKADNWETKQSLHLTKISYLFILTPPAILLFIKMQECWGRACSWEGHLRICRENIA